MPSYSGLYNNQYNDGQTAIGVGLPTSVVVDTNERNSRLRTDMGQVFRRRAGRIMAQLIIQLTGSAPGNIATVTHRRVAAPVSAGNPMSNGGRQTIETQTLLNRATTAADETRIDSDFSMMFGPSTYPVDRSGNGGGGKAGAF